MNGKATRTQGSESAAFIIDNSVKIPIITLFVFENISLILRKFCDRL